MPFIVRNKKNGLRNSQKQFLSLIVVIDKQIKNS